MTDIIMPKLSDTMTEGQLGTWLKAVGDRIAKGDVIAEVETDKATMELEAFASGVLLEKRVEPGQMVPVGTVLGVIGEPGEISAKTPVSQGPSARERTEAKPAEEPSKPVSEARATKPVAPDRAREKSSPMVRRQAQEMNINIDEVQGSGPDGRVVLADLMHHAEKLKERESGLADRPVAKPAAVPKMEEKHALEPKSARQADEAQPMTRMRSAIARTVAESWRTIPHFSVTAEVLMDRAEEVRRELNTNSTHISLNDMAIKAASLALQKFPRVNASFTEGSITYHHEINIGCMVTIDDGLLVPVIRGCETLSLKEIATRSRQLIEQARNGTISEMDMDGGTFSLSNLGMYGVRHFSAIILPPQAAILALGAVSDAVVAKNGAAVVSPVMKVTLSADHRVLDGAYAAQFLQELKSIFENPVQLVL